MFFMGTDIGGTRKSADRSSIQRVSYTEIYRSIEHHQDLSGAQLLYLKRLVERKLRVFDPRIDLGELEMKPYGPTEEPATPLRLEADEEDDEPSLRFQAADEPAGSGRERRAKTRRRILGTVVVKGRPRVFPSGVLLDIHTDGLAFRYREKAGPLYEIRELDIIWADFVATHQLRGLPVRSVSDVAIGDGDGSGIVTRRRSVRFEKLPAAQRNTLERLIREHGTPSA